MKVSKIDGNGNHLLLEGYGGDFDRLNDEELIKDFLDSLPSKIKMNKISEVLISNYENGEESGISGVILLAESHISIHTYPLKNFAVADIFSCKEFDVDKILKLINNNFKFNKINHRLIVREYEKN